MTQVRYGERLGSEGSIRVGCSAAIFDADGRVLLTRRADNGQWCLPSGGMEPGESAMEACAREVIEETGLIVRVKRLVGIYSDPNQLVVYADGNKVQILAVHFEAEIVGGELGLSDETTDYGYFSRAEVDAMDLLGHHKERIIDTWAAQVEAFFE